MAFEEIYAPNPDDPNADSMFVGTGKINRNLAKTFEINPTTGETVTPVILGQEMDANGNDIVNAPNLATTAQTTYGDNYLSFGPEYLVSVTSKIIAGTSFTVALVGDSNTEYNGTNFFSGIFKRRIEQSFPNATVTNYGVSGSTTYEWENNTVSNPIGRLSTQLAATPDLWFIRYGTNDANYRASLTLEQALDQWETAMDDALSLIRSTQGGPTSTTIVLCTPTAADTTYANPAWNNGLNPRARALARKHQCFFLDMYGFANDPAGGWMPDMIHPGPTFNYRASEWAFEAIFPFSIQAQYGTFGIPNTPAEMGNLDLNGNVSMLGGSNILWGGTAFIAATGNINLNTNYPTGNGVVYLNGSAQVGLSFAVGLSTATGTGSLSWAENVALSRYSLLVGTDSNASTRTNATFKASRTAGVHYLTAEEPISIVGYDCDSGGGVVYIGGQDSTLNAAVFVDIYAGANGTTLGGTQVARFGATGAQFPLGAILKAPNNSLWKIVVDNTGALSTTAA